jgi:hypothetical protein
MVESPICQARRKLKNGDRHDDAEQLDPPARRRTPRHRQVHADMAAQALGVGDPQEGEQRRRLLDPVDVAVDGEVEDGAADDLRHADEHQEKDGEGRHQVEAVLDVRQGCIGLPQEQWR